jgi:hypothetical protein
MNCGKMIEARNRAKYEHTNFCNRKCQGEYTSRVRVGANAFRFQDRKIEVVCANCGKPVIKFKRFVERFDKSFCNRKCQGEYYRKHSADVSGEKSPAWTGGMITKKCETCGKEFKTFQCLKDRSRFCSNKCMEDWLSTALRGENHYNWKGGVSGERKLEMSRREYMEWRRLVFEHDHYTCQKCGDKRGHNLQAHHIERWVDNHALRFDVNNGITLCRDCHKAAHRKVKEAKCPEILTAP